MNTPVLLITFLRPESTLKILNIIRKNKIKDLFVFNDGPRNKNDVKKILATRKVIDKFRLNGRIYKMYEKKNIGLRNNIPKALEWVFKKFNKAIILECDCIPNNDFFRFCEELLNKYEDDIRISQISGTNFLKYKNFLRRNNDSYYFSKLTPSWGWATWKNRWLNTYDKDISTWPMIKKEGWLKDILTKQSEINYWKNIFDRRYKGIDIDWDRSWAYVNFINHRLSIQPSRNLISSVGYDDVAAHENAKKWKELKLEKLNFPLKHPIVITADTKADQFVIKGGYSKPNFIYRLKNKIKNILNTH